MERLACLPAGPATMLKQVAKGDWVVVEEKLIAPL